MLYADKITEVDKNGIFVGISYTPSCWKNPMDVSELMEEQEDE